MESGPSKDSIDKPVTIQDMVVYGTPGKAKGEFNNLNADEATQETRLMSVIQDLFIAAGSQHQALNCDARGNLQKDKLNSITRLTTNEFSFYTQKPLTVAEFESIQNKVYALARLQPENMHMILSSFAVKTPDNKVMNVVAHVECGPDPKINLIVKNHPSDLDPEYSEESEDGIITILPNVNIRKDNIDDYKIKINGKDHAFSFNNVLECKTAGGSKFFVLIDICLDHTHGVAKKRFEDILQNAEHAAKQGKSNNLMPKLCSHVLTSNTNYIQAHNMVVPMTHADNVESIKNTKMDSAEVYRGQFTATGNFGTPLNMTITEPTICNQLTGSHLALVKSHNKHVKNASKPLNILNVAIKDFLTKEPAKDISLANDAIKYLQKNGSKDPNLPIWKQPGMLGYELTAIKNSSGSLEDKNQKVWYLMNYTQFRSRNDVRNAIGITNFKTDRFEISPALAPTINSTHHIPNSLSKNNLTKQLSTFLSSSPESINPLVITNTNTNTNNVLFSTKPLAQNPMQSPTTTPLPSILTTSTSTTTPTATSAATSAAIPEATATVQTSVKKGNHK